MTTTVIKALVSVAYDATQARDPKVKLAEFRGMLQVLSRDGTNEALLELAEFLARDGHPSTWVQS